MRWIEKAHSVEFSWIHRRISSSLSYMLPSPGWILLDKERTVHWHNNWPCQLWEQRKRYCGVFLNKLQNTKTSKSSSGNIIIYNAGPADEGLYQCVASNTEGVVFSRVSKVMVTSSLTILLKISFKMSWQVRQRRLVSSRRQEASRLIFHIWKYFTVTSYCLTSACACV